MVMDERLRVLVRNTSQKTKGTYCDGCASFEVLQRKRKFHTDETYWCDRLKGYFEPATMCLEKCPRREKVKPYKPRFFKWKEKYK